MIHIRGFSFTASKEAARISGFISYLHLQCVTLSISMLLNLD